MLARQSQQQSQAAAAAAALGSANDSFQQFGQCKMRTSVLRELIEDYRKSEVLWNSNLKNYYNKSLRQQAVAKLANKYQCSEVDINSKIKNLRTYFLKELKKSATITENGQPYQSTWFAFDSMLFVKEHIKPRRSRYNQLMRLIQDAQDCANQDDDIQNELDDESDTGDDEMSDIVQLSDDDDQPEMARKFSVAHLAIAESSSHSSVELNGNDGENPTSHLAEPGQSSAHKRPASEPDLAVNWRGQQQASPNSRCSLNAESERSVSLSNRNSEPIRDPTVPHHNHHHTNHSSSSSSVTDSSPWHQPSNTGKRKSSQAFASPTSTTNAAAVARSLAVGQVPIASETMMDECAIFGALVAQKLRNLPTARFRSLAQNRICNLLFELEMTVADSSDG